MRARGRRVEERSRRVVHLTTVPMTLRFLSGQLRSLSRCGYDIHVASSPGPDLGAFAEAEGVVAHAVAMERRITPVRDLAVLARLGVLLAKVRPTIVHAHTPKAGLIGTLAALLAAVPVRIYHVHGLPFLTARGPRRRLLRATEWAAARLATQVLCVSRSVQEVAVAEGLCPAHKIAVLGGGSINGVDTRRFRPPAAAERRAARLQHGLAAEDQVIGYVGRIVADKGWVELALAWRQLRDRFPRAHLLAVGPFESQDPVPTDVVELIRSDPRIHHLGLQWDTPPLYSTMDVVVLPTYREGFPVVPLEAAAMGLPVVATRVPGCTDAIVDGVTGTLVPPRDAEALAAAVARYLEEPALRNEHGTAARERVLSSFSQEVIWEETGALYGRLLARAGEHQRGWRLVCKSALDRAVAAAGLVLASPLLLVTAAIVRLGLGSPVLFRQTRPGRHGKPFQLVKFRTMKDARGPDGALLPDDARLTRVGRFLRSTSLDEFPQLWNVLQGDLSLVGPRPLLMQYLDRYTPDQARRHEVLPGITGWAQVNGRNAISWEERFALDLWYVANWSLRLDASILLKTIGRVTRREGVSREGHATMPEFMGTERPGPEGKS
jgi:lipopolysaccharide/colanic/teichoic acid biosynthesis glycosyltransferase/glycosyltransferase involved in cell wall biosynthesis